LKPLRSKRGQLLNQELCGIAAQHLAAVRAMADVAIRTQSNKAVT
jgi:hypothetical protein